MSGISAAPGKELYISGRPGGKEEQLRLKQKISVLAKTWKVIAVLDRQGLGLQGVTANTSEAIPVMMPNDSRVQGKGWKSFRGVADSRYESTFRLMLQNLPYLAYST
ncbi:hypothetical protein Q5692_39120 [Microcoleus sp. C2C3]|uniref:hypothetical protein n=1 Tax=unclassified Microcoleus TaxID=2642155 RepID=UPI002FD39DA2